MKVMFMLAGTNRGRHKSLRTALKNSYTVSWNKYPAITTELLSMMNNWKPEPTNVKHNRFMAARQDDRDELNFAQKAVPAGKPADDEGEKTGVSMVQTKAKQSGRGKRVVFKEATKHTLPKSWICM